MRLAAEHPSAEASEREGGDGFGIGKVGGDAAAPQLSFHSHGTAWHAVDAGIENSN